MATTIDTRVKGRVGSPNLPLLPMCTIPIGGLDDKFPNWVLHMKQLREILTQNNIEAIYLDVVYRVHPGAVLHDSRITIMAVSAYKPESKTTWPLTVRRIRQYLNKIHVNHSIEIITPILYQGPKSFPFATDIYQWNTVLLPKIHSIIDCTEWITLDMVYREDAEGSKDKIPTILIGARDANQQHWWDNTLPALRHEVAQSGIQIELFYHDRFFTTTPNAKALKNSLGTSRIRLGASCGPAGGDSGTLGGLVRLKEPDTSEEIALGISNHHVLASKLPGKAPFMNPEDSITVESPSSSDRDFYKAELKEDIKTEKLQESNGRNAYLKILEDELAQVENFDLYVGKVFASSGLRSAKNTNRSVEKLTGEWALDWCLSTVAERGIMNTFHGLDSIGIKRITGYCSINPYQGYRVFKKGRTTGATAGFISATESLLRTQVPEPESGCTALVLKETFPNPVRCHSLIGDRRTDQTGEFIQPGDSGSLILLDPYNFSIEEWEAGNSGRNAPFKPSVSSTSENNEGEDKDEALVAGLAFGSTNWSMVSYMAPMDLVVQDIESVTKMKVIEPKFVGLVENINKDLSN